MILRVGVHENTQIKRQGWEDIQIGWVGDVQQRRERRELSKIEMMVGQDGGGGKFLGYAPQIVSGGVQRVATRHMHQSEFF